MATIYGFGACRCMVDSLPMIEDRLRRAGAIRENLSGLIAQGAYSDGALSAGTHSGGGAIDVAYSTVDTDAKVLAWRTSGVAMWPRTETDSAKFGGSNRHGHGIWIGCPHHPAADYQVTAYRNGRDGLINNRADRYPRPPIVTWQQALATWISSIPAGGSGPLPPTSEEIDMGVADDLREEIRGLRSVLDARTSPNIPGTRLEAMNAELKGLTSVVNARTSPKISGARLETMSGLLRDVSSGTGPANPIVAHARGISAYEQIPGIRAALADLAAQLAELRDVPSDDVRQALADAGDALRRAAAELDPIPEYDPATTSTTQDGA